MPKTMLSITLTTSALLLLSAYILFATGLEETLAFSTYNAYSSTAWFIREWSNAPPLLLTAAALIFLTLPILKNKYPALRQVSAVWVLVALLGVGLLNQVLIKQAVQRPRPREDVLTTLNDTLSASGKYVTTAPTAALKGNSMPSGHAGTAFLMLIPAIPLWHRHRKLAAFFLISGTLYGLGVSWARMTLGAHYISDVMTAAAINIAGAGIATHFIKRTTKISSLWPLGLFAIAGATIIATKKFTIDLVWQGEITQTPTFTLPCTITLPPNTSYPTNATLNITLKGQGLPETWVYLTENNNHFSIKKYGFQHSLACTAKLTTIK